MLLAVDIGNTNVTLGIFEGEALRGTWRVSTDASRTSDEYGVQIVKLLNEGGVERGDVESVVYASVVPTLVSVFEAVFKRYLDEVSVLRVGAGVKTGLRVRYEDPREVGADRIVDAVAALRLHAPPLIVVDVGTAIVFDAISREGDYLGGAIAPGIAVAANALAQKAAMLRHVDLRPPKHAVGNNTTTSMQSGILFGYADLIEGMIRRFKAEIGEDAWVVATGGWAPLMSQITRVFDRVDEDLTLTGLRLVHEMNAGPS